MSVHVFIANINVALRNPALSPAFGTSSTESAPYVLARLIATLWRVFLTLGGLAVIIFMAWGAFAWITSGGDKAQIEAARNRITAAIIGMAILFSMFALIVFIFPAIGFDILNPEIPDNLNE